MIFSTTMATIGSIWALKDKPFNAGIIGISFLGLLFVAGTISFIIKEKRDH
jgi:hypothetical protein